MYFVHVLVVRCAAAQVPLDGMGAVLLRPHSLFDFRFEGRILEHVQREWTLLTLDDTAHSGQHVATKLFAAVAAACNA